MSCYFIVNTACRSGLCKIVWLYFTQFLITTPLQAYPILIHDIFFREKDNHNTFFAIRLNGKILILEWIKHVRQNKSTLLQPCHNGYNIALLHNILHLREFSTICFFFVSKKLKDSRNCGLFLHKLPTDSNSNRPTQCVLQY